MIFANSRAARLRNKRQSSSSFPLHKVPPSLQNEFEHFDQMPEMQRIQFVPHKFTLDRWYLPQMCTRVQLSATNLQWISVLSVLRHRTKPTEQRICRAKQLHCRKKGKEIRKESVRGSWAARDIALHVRGGPLPDEMRTRLGFPHSSPTS